VPPPPFEPETCRYAFPPGGGGSAPFTGEQALHVAVAAMGVCAAAMLTPFD
jgi:hypothetical protein